MANPLLWAGAYGLVALVGAFGLRRYLARIGRYAWSLRGTTLVGDLEPGRATVAGTARPTEVGTRTPKFGEKPCLAERWKMQEYRHEDRNPNASMYDNDDLFLKNLRTEGRWQTIGDESAMVPMVLETDSGTVRVGFDEDPAVVTPLERADHPDGTDENPGGSGLFTNAKHGSGRSDAGHVYPGDDVLVRGTVERAPDRDQPWSIEPGDDGLKIATGTASLLRRRLAIATGATLLSLAVLALGIVGVVGVVAPGAVPVEWLPLPP